VTVNGKDWWCPNCTEVAHTVDSKLPHHRCVKVGLMVPLLQVGVPAKLVLVEREDMIAGEHVQYSGDESHRPYMSAVVTRDDGQDTTVFAPTATAEGVS